MQIRKGENVLIKVIFSDAYGMEIPYADITTLEITFKQIDTTLASYTKADDEVRAGDNSREAEIELTTTVSNTLQIGKPLSITYKVTVANTDFDVDQSQTDIIEKKLADVIG